MTESELVLKVSNGPKINGAQRGGEGGLLNSSGTLLHYFIPVLLLDVRLSPTYCTSTEPARNTLIGNSHLPKASTLDLFAAKKRKEIKF